MCIRDRKYAFVFMIFALAALGLPGTSGFVGEFLVLVGVFQINIAVAVLASLGVILAAAYMLWMLQRLALGEPSTEAAKVLPDLSNRELGTLIPLAILALCIGLFPGPLMEMMDASVIHLIQQTTGLQVNE